jgi:hypothetical protein
VEVGQQSNEQLPSPSLSIPTPVMPAAGPNRTPILVGCPPTATTAYTPTTQHRRRARSRRGVVAIGVLLLVAIGAGGYLGLRSYIYGDDVPGVTILDDPSG